MVVATDTPQELRKRAAMLLDEADRIEGKVALVFQPDCPHCEHCRAEREAGPECDR